MSVCIKVPSTGYKTHVFCEKEITENDFAPMTIQGAVVECIRPDEFRVICPKCRIVMANYITPAFEDYPNCEEIIKWAGNTDLINAK